MPEPWSTRTERSYDGPSGSDDDTITLLQEEIARLENELRMRDETAAMEREASRPDPRRHKDDEASERRFAQLGDELASREETIALLLEQIRLSDEAEAASRAEWEQLQRWVEEVECRVAERGESEPDTEIRDQLDAERRTSEALRQGAEKEQRSWDVQRQALVAEVERLRARFTEVAGESDTTVAAVRALEHENQELRTAYHELANSSYPSHEVDAIVVELQAVRKERDTLTQQVQRERDDRLREHNEHEAALNAIKSQITRESLRRQEEHVKTTAALPTSKDPLLEADERIRAFREHLKEIHQDEAEQRMKRTLAARLSRLWHHTGPNS
jgi:hypothetical protein